ncbi:LuxR C-terminal-related transcriptional regulator [Streptomyces sp. T028]|uniref:LuxR C-terminal-related transcriptional regulator n=1 Tax=Streptomyces sp. T028 TaxID=3394379 RepID=UPI003A85CEF9
MTTIGTPAGTLRLPWPFTGREEELELVRRSLAAGRPGIVLTGPAGCGRTRLAAEALRGTDCARAAGTPGTRGTAFAAFAPLLPEGVTLHRAVQLLSDVRLLLVDDAHLLDDASAALLYQLAVRGRTRLLVVVTEGACVPDAVTRLWTGELLPRLALEPLPAEDTAQLLTADAGGPLEALTVDRLHRLCRGDLRLLRDLLAAVRDEGLLTSLPGTDERAWRGRIPLTPTLRERTAPVLARPCPDERETLDRLAFAEPLPLAADTLNLHVLERLETDGLIEADDGEPATVRLAHPLYGPVLRAAAGRLRARRLTMTRRPLDAALDAEAAALTHGIEQADVRTVRAPVGEWLVAEGEPVPPGYAAVRARHARLRGAPREAAAWAREGLSNAPQDPACHRELALAAIELGETVTTAPATARHQCAAPAAARARRPAPESQDNCTTPAARNDCTAPTARDDGMTPAARGDCAAPAARDGRTASVAGDGRTAPAARDVCTAPTAGDDGTATAARNDCTAPTTRDDGTTLDARDGRRAPVVRDGRTAPAARDVCTAPTAGDDGTATAARGDCATPAARDGRTASVAGDGRTAPAARDVCTAPTARDDGTTPAARDDGTTPAARDDGTTPAARGDFDAYDAVRQGVPERALGHLPSGSVFDRHARALADADGPALDRVAEELAERGFLLFAAEAHAQAVRVHRDPTAARTARTRAVALARRCQGACTPALSGLALGELTARQRQIVTLAASGLSNRQIAERLTLSVRTVGNHLYGAYTRLGAGDRAALPWLMEQPA